jgi:serine/threonine protein kinase
MDLKFRFSRCFCPIGLKTGPIHPEILLHNDFYERGIDIWSAGCVVSEMCGGVPLGQSSVR